jgi:hypothetical protein
MFTTIINDCRDDNARARQESRLASLLGTPLSFVGVQSDLEAGVQLIDILDATEGRPGLILVNVAPRGGHTTKWENGTPFAYFRHHDTLIVSSVDGYALSGVKKFVLAKSVQLLDTHSAATAMAAAGFVDAGAAARIPTTQFRSFDFTPRVDNFGNCKTTLTTADLAGASELATRFGSLPHVAKLRDLPDGHHALVSGSSGLGDTRFLELMMQRQSFAKHHAVRLGDDLFSPTSHFRQATD